MISWSQPVPFDLIFDSPNIDWSAGTPFPSSSSTSEVFQASKEKGMKEVNAINWYPGKLDSFFGRKVAQFKEGSVRVWLDFSPAFSSSNSLASNRSRSTAAACSDLSTSLRFGRNSTLSDLRRQQSTLAYFLTSFDLRHLHSSSSIAIRLSSPYRALSWSECRFEREILAS